MQANSDQDQLSRYARTKDDADFRPLVVRYAPLVFRACYGRLGRRDLAEDATQAVFILLAERAARIRCGVTLAPWLLAASKRCSQRIARSERRRNAYETPLTDDLPTKDDDSVTDVVAALEQLRGDERDAIVLRFVQGLSFAEVGETLGLSEDAARMRVRRGLDRLRNRLAPMAALPPAFVDRLSQPSRARTHPRPATARRYLSLNTGHLILVPIGVAFFCAPLLLARQGFGGGTSSKTAPSRQQPAASMKARTFAKGKFHFDFESYFGKTPDWFVKNVGQPDGAGSGPQSTIQWRTYRRRADLGGGQARIGSASYSLGNPVDGNTLSVTFDWPAGKQPVATQVAHGISASTIGHTLAQELAYVGVSLNGYRQIAGDPSYPEGTKLYLKKANPKMLLVVEPMNGGYQIELDQHNPPPGRQP